MHAIAQTHTHTHTLCTDGPTCTQETEMWDFRHGWIHHQDFLRGPPGAKHDRGAPEYIPNENNSLKISQEEVTTIRVLSLKLGLYRLVCMFCVALLSVNKSIMCGRIPKTNPASLNTILWAPELQQKPTNIQSLLFVRFLAC